MDETAEIESPAINEISVKPKQLAGLVLDTLEFDSIQKARAIAYLADKLDPNDPFQSEIINAAGRMQKSIEETVAMGRDAAGGKPFPILDKGDALGTYFFLGDELTPNSSRLEIKDRVVDPKKSSDQAHLVDLICRTLENSTRQAATGVFGYSEIMSLRSSNPEAKELFGKLNKQSKALSNDTSKIAEVREASFNQKPIRVALRDNKQILVLS